MFDELARRGNGYSEHVVVSSPCNIPVALQKRLSLVPRSHRGSVFNQLRTSSDVVKSCQPDQEEKMSHHTKMGLVMEGIMDAAITKDVKSVKEANVYTTLENNDSQCDREGCRTDEKSREVSYRRDSSGLTPLRYNRRCRNTGRPLSGSSVASSTSSSGCSNQGNTCTINPYLASVESLADTCASSQGSGDSGVVTVSEASCRIGNDRGGQRRDSAEEDATCRRPRYCDPHRNPVERVLLEIVDTEAIYVDHLRQVIQGYLIFWRDDHTSFAQKMQLTDLFSNIEDIFKFNREFLKEIEKCSLDPVCVANTFIKHNSGFKVYTEYCTNYPRTVSVLTDLMGQEETANAFRERQAALGHALPLGSFLLKPVQRILKYHLLLENLSKEYGADCNFREDEAVGRKAIEGALAAMTGIAKHINAMKRRHEHAVRVQEIQSLLYGWPGPDLTTSGELIAEGRFRMRGAKAPRHAFLFDRMLLLTKKKEDGLLVYKAHIMCSNLMLIESIPGELLSFHVIPFDNPRLQYTLQARNLEQKREWTLQIKRVILENYNAVIPSHARQLVLQLGQTQPDDDVFADRGSAKKQHSAPPEYLEKRKQERERRRSETGLRQKFKKGGRKSETTTENSSASPRKNENENSNISDSREQAPKSLDGRTLKVKDRFTGWRRKSEPGFQSYVCLNQSDEDQRGGGGDAVSGTAETESAINPVEEKSTANSLLSEIKDCREDKTQAQTVEEIVGHILMQNQEFQKLLEKQRPNSTINVRQQQRFHKHISAAGGCSGIDADTSDESDSESLNYITENSNNKVAARIRTAHREHRLVRTNNSWNSSLSSSRDNQPTLQLLYDNFKNESNKLPVDSGLKNKGSRVHEKKALFEAFKRQSIVTDSRVIKTALRIRENSVSGNEELDIRNSKSYFGDFGKEEACKKNTDIESNEENQEVEEVKKEKCAIDNAAHGFGNYDNLQHVWEGLQERKEMDGSDSPTRPAIWLTKLCEGLPTSPQKCGSLPRSFQINPNPNQNLTKARFLQRDGKPMSERPFTIASDKPAEINLEDMERYATSCQPEGRIAKFPTSISTSSSTFFYSLDDTLTDAYSDIQAPSLTMTNIHPDHKIYRANTGGNTLFKNVLSKAGNRLQVLRNTMSTETLECSEEFERTKYFRSLSTSKLKKKGKLKHGRESSSDIEELVGCTARGSSDSKFFSSSTLYYKQGSSSLGARIAQSDYADPTVLFSEAKRLGQLVNSSITNVKKNENGELENTQQEQNGEVVVQDEVDEENGSREMGFREREDQEDEEEDTINHGLSETDSFYEKSFETIENYVDVDVDDAFRDSAIFSDIEESLVTKSPYSTNLTSTSEESTQFRSKIAPPVPRKKKSEFIAMTHVSTENVSPRCKPSIAQKPDHLKLKSAVSRGPRESEIKLCTNCLPQSETCQFSRHSLQNCCVEDGVDERDDVSAGQSQAGWVRKIVGQLQGHIEM